MTRLVNNSRTPPYCETALWRTVRCAPPAFSAHEHLLMQRTTRTGDARAASFGLDVPEHAFLSILPAPRLFARRAARRKTRIWRAPAASPACVLPLDMADHAYATFPGPLPATHLLPSHIPHLPPVPLCPSLWEVLFLLLALLDTVVWL